MEAFKGLIDFGYCGYVSLASLVALVAMWREGKKKDEALEKARQSHIADLKEDRELRQQLLKLIKP